MSRLLDVLDDRAYRRELAVVTRVVESYPRCYYAWNYRIWLVEQLVERNITLSLSLSLSSSQSTSNVDNARLLLLAELFDNARWLRRHVGDGSAYAHRRFLLRRLLTLFDDHAAAADVVVEVEFWFSRHIVLYVDENILFIYMSFRFVS